MTNPFLVGDRVYLRGLEFEDLEGNYVSWLNDEVVCKYNSHHVFPYTKEAALNYIRFIQSSKNNLVLAVVLKDSDLHIGNISLQEIDHISRSAEFAILFGEKSCWGKGYAKEASILLIEHGFKELNLHRIYCGTSSDNIPMQKLALHQGMTKEGCRRGAIYKNGKFKDLFEYGLLKEEFFNKFGLK